MEPMRLKDRIAIVTGSDSGIGQATAIAFAEEGADVVITYLQDAKGADRTRLAVEALGQRALVVHCDQRDPRQVEKLFKEVHKKLGTPTILVNNAGVYGPEKTVEKMALEDWDNGLISLATVKLTHV